MTTISALVRQLADPALTDAKACAASDALAAIDDVIRGSAPLAEKIAATRIAEQRGWNGLLPDYLQILAGEAAR